MGGEFPADRASQEEWEIPLVGYLFSLLNSLVSRFDFRQRELWSYALRKSYDTDPFFADGSCNAGWQYRLDGARVWTGG